MLKNTQQCIFFLSKSKFKSGNPEISPGGVKNENNSKIPKLCQDIGLDELFLEKLL